MSVNSPLNSLFNSPSNLNSSLMLLFSVLLQNRSEQHLNPATVFSLLSLLSLNSTHLLKVDSSYTDSDFKKLLFHFAYGSSSFSPFSPNNTTDSSTTSKEFTAFYQLSLHVFSSPFSHYYSLH
jgi:hypothetical protein